MTLVEQTALTSRNITGGYLVNLLTARLPAPSPRDNAASPCKFAAGLGLWLYSRL